MPRAKKKLSDSESEDSDSGPDDRNNASPASKKAKPNAKESLPTSWVLEKQRQVRINEFRGRKLIDIREFYEKNGETLPGKKGISLSVEQWKKLLQCADEINEALQRS